MKTSEIRMALLRPGGIVERLKAVPVVYVPFGPLEWHGPHLAYGMDGLNAENAALESCKRTGGVVWPTQFWGAERERRLEQLESLGFPTDKYVVGMDFPKNLIPSCYCPEEVFAILVREILREVIAIGGRVAVLVNGHGGENHLAVLKRLETEFNNTTPLRVYFRMAAPLEPQYEGSGEHAGPGETSILMHIHPDSVDVAQLPPLPEPLKYTDWAVVDGPGFDGKGPNNGYLGDKDDPRRASSPELGKRIVDRTADEIAAEVDAILNEIKPRR